MSKFVIILGGSGSGKSTAIKSLDSSKTFIINVLGKSLPFKGNAYSRESQNMVVTSNWETIDKLLCALDKKESIKTIIIDDAVYIMRTEFFDRSRERGYEKYNEIADHFRRIVWRCSTLRNDLIVYMVLHSEAVDSDGGIITYKSSSIGKLLDKMYNPLESSAICLFCQPRYSDSSGRPEYGFYTHALRVNGIELPAKTPDGMFSDDFIDNDLNLVNKVITSYYG